MQSKFWINLLTFSINKVSIYGSKLLSGRSNMSSKLDLQNERQEAAVQQSVLLTTATSNHETKIMTILDGTDNWPPSKQQTN